jgi:tetratricopeptide (TPR) repeat protein
MNFGTRILVLVFIVFSQVIISCKVYHNTTARFNSYFLAKEKMLELEEQIFATFKDDYNTILRVLPPVDSASSAANKASTDYIIEKASNPIQYHDESKWVDDSYLLIAKARLYANDMKNAVGTFKYVNTISNDKDAKHAALIGLMRTYVEMRQFENADFVIDYIARETVPFSEANERDFYLTAAHYYRQLNNYDKCGEYLQKAIPLVSPAKKRARLIFLLGQILRLQGRNEAAFEAFSAVKKSNPAYDLLFNAELAASQVFSSDKPADIESAEKNFKKMLRDDKNKDMKDRVYYEMADFYFKTGKINEGLAALNNAIVHADPNNKTQKAYAYLKFGEIYYDKLQNFEKAGIYYDSAKSVLTSDMKGYSQAIDRIEVLSEFIEHFRALELNERLLALAEMSTSEREKLFAKEIEDEKKAIDRRIELEENKKKTGSNPFAAAEKSWYFYDAAAVELGLRAFRKDWGDRPLEDHWRRSAKPRSEAANPEKDLALSEEAQKELRYKSVKSLAEREKIVPKSEGEISACRQKLAVALFNLGKIYYYKLNEKSKSLQYLQRLNKSFPDFEPRAEVLYMLYLLCKDTKKCDENMYASALETNFPYSTFAKLIKDPNLLKDGEKGSEEAEAAYAKAYEFYKQKRYTETVETIDQTLFAFPKSNLSDRLIFLKIFCLPHTAGKSAYIKALEDFVTRYPDSPLKQSAQNMLKAAE